MLNNRPGGLLASITGLLVILLGSLVLLGGWINHDKAAWFSTQLPNMAYNSAASFFFAGIGLLLIKRYRYFSLFFSIVVTLLAILTLLQYVLYIPLSINNLFSLSSMPSVQMGVMPPNSALGFLLSGLALVLMAQFSTPKYIATTISALGLLIFVWSAVSLIGYLANLPATNTWRDISRMPFHSAIGFMVLSIGIVANSYRAGLMQRSNLSIFLPLTIIVVGSVFFILLWQALIVNEHRAIRQLVRFELNNVVAQVSEVLSKQKPAQQQFRTAIKKNILPILQRSEADGFNNSIYIDGAKIYSTKKINKNIQQHFSAATHTKLNHTWFDIKVWPSQELVDQQLTYYPLFILMVGLVFTFLLGLLVHLWQKLRVRERILTAEIMQRQRAEEELQHVAYFDYLTGLSNRFLFEKDIETAVARANRHKRIVGVGIIDIDDFREINEALGRDIGDEILKILAHRFKFCVREVDMLARLNGGTFGIIIDEMIKKEDANIVAQRILQALDTPISIRSQQIDISVSIGIALYPNDGNTVNRLIGEARIALKRVKNAGGGRYEFFVLEKKPKNEYLYKLESALHQALTREEFVLHYMPIVNIHNNNQIESLEVLIRWRHKEMGWISPDEFIPIAENLGLIIPIGDWILKQACQDYNKWRIKQLTNFRIAVNLSVPQLMQADLSERIKDVFQTTNMSPKEVQFEITETSIMRYLKKANITLKTLADLGIEILLDDFGTGYSSLTYLYRLPISGLKIDKSFIAKVVEDQSSIKIVTSVINLARSLGIKVVAEGVENDEQVEVLRKLNCQFIQGNFISRSLPFDEMTQFLNNR